MWMWGERGVCLIEIQKKSENKSKPNKYTSILAQDI